MVNPKKKRGKGKHGVKASVEPKIKESKAEIDYLCIEEDPENGHVGLRRGKMVDGEVILDEIKDPSLDSSGTETPEFLNGLPDSFGPHDPIGIPCGVLFSQFDGIMLTTNREQLDDIRETLIKNHLHDLPDVFNQISTHLLQYSPDEFEVHRRNQDKQWDEWFSCVIYFVSLRWMLFKREIPIVDLRNVEPRNSMRK